MASIRERITGRTRRAFERHGQRLALTNAAGDLSHVYCHLNNDDLGAEVGGGPVMVQSNAPVFVTLSDDIDAAGVVAGDGAVHDQVSYVIRQLDHNGHGICRLHVTEVT